MGTRIHVTDTNRARRFTEHLTIKRRTVILTDMIRMTFQIDDTISPLLQAEQNQSKLVRDLLRNHYSDIPTSVNDDIRRGTVAIYKLLKEMDSKIDYIASRLK